jgi:acyl-CoA reductase-like NAD-dependent aldehyde dehydrogenase
MSERLPYYLAGVAVTGPRGLAVHDKYTGRTLAEVSLAGPHELDRAIAAAVAAEPSLRRTPSHLRRQWLATAAARFRARSDELADVLCGEAGKPLRDARGEVGRLVDTFEIAAEEATRGYGEVLPLDVTPRATGYRGMTKRVPLGAVGFITPFNFPLNLVAHKVAPALAVGCPFVLKPASSTPLGALIVGEVLAELDLPKGAFSILPARGADAEVLATDPRLKRLSFTGSDEVGWALKAKAGKKRVTLELGGNAAVIVDEGVDLADVVERIVVGAFYQSGQSCISVQRILAVGDVYEELRSRLTARTMELVAGDPRDEHTFCGPLITEGDAERLAGWIESARHAGAELLCGGGRRGAVLEPTLLADVPREHPLVAEEAFGPVAVLQRVPDFAAALQEANRSRFGLQAGVFTRDLHRALAAWDELEVGGVLVNEVPSWRVDHMPYGGVKDSGLGREGVRYAMEELTELRLLVIRDADLGTRAAAPLETRP